MTIWLRIASVFLGELRWFRRRVGGLWIRRELGGARGPCCSTYSKAMWFHEDQDPRAGVVSDIERHPSRLPRARVRAL